MEVGRVAHGEVFESENVGALSSPKIGEVAELYEDGGVLPAPSERGLKPAATTKKKRRPTTGVGGGQRSVSRTVFLSGHDVGIARAHAERQGCSSGGNLCQCSLDITK